METCFENSAELMEFFKEHISEIAEKYENFVSAERNKKPIRLYSCAYSAVRDFIFEQGLSATDCQINKMAEIFICRE